MGDNEWAQPLSRLPEGLRLYLMADTQQSATLGTMFIMIWALHLFPDQAWVQAASDLSVKNFLNWVTVKVFSERLAEIVGFSVDASARWVSGPKLRVWNQALSSASKNRETLLNNIGLPEDPRLKILLQDPQWPAITAGGPRHLHTARHFQNSLLPLLNEIDQATWPTLHVDKVSALRYGWPAEQLSPVHRDPVGGGPKLLCDPGMESLLPQDVTTITDETLKDIMAARPFMTKKAIILELARTRPDDGTVFSFLFFEF